jgi:hydroxymethylbilane synthase
MKKLRIAARQSHLARYQALRVGEALTRVAPGLPIDYRFRESLGDINAHDPLWKMPEKGVFTEDFLGDLREGRCDLVVHSWKDLPLGPREGTEIVATLPRADARDLLLVSRQAWQRFVATSARGEFVVLTSSPRRTHNLGGFLTQALPGGAASVRFEPVRGNIPTRIRKLFAHAEAHGLILAKAALDRLLGAPASFGPDFVELREELRGLLNDARFMVLPLSRNPTAAAQGALAIELAANASAELRELINKIHCPATFAAVEEERRILGSYGGGCHQKIGVSCQVRDYGEVLSLRGLTDAGETLNRYGLVSGRALEGVPAPSAVAGVFPRDPKQARFFTRAPLSAARPSTAQGFWVAREEAWPADWEPRDEDLVWTAGVRSWFKLAARGVWVQGCADGLGEEEDPGLTNLLGHAPAWVKLSHAEGVQAGNPVLATYRLRPREDFPIEELQRATHFYWMSGTAFRRALELVPAIRNGWHFTGPGHTARAVAAALGSTERVRTEVSYEAWLARWG